jgi:Holliday junction resolvase-like predicted endonuclease
VEVKSARPGPFGPPELRVTKTKQRRIAIAALEYLSYLDYQPEGVRFDVIAITWREGRAPEICHLEAAFSAEAD